MAANVKISPEQFDDWQVGCCATIRCGIRFENQPSRCMVRMKKFLHKARFAYASFTHNRHYVTVTAVSKLRCLAELFQLNIAIDEIRQAACGGSLETRSRCIGTRYLIYRYQIDETLNR